MKKNNWFKIKGKMIFAASMVLLFMCGMFSSAQQPEIRINLGGYATDMPKTALLLSNKSFDKPILLLKNEKGETVDEYVGKLNNNPWPPFSYYYTFDFSDFLKNGK